MLSIKREVALLFSLFEIILHKCTCEQAACSIFGGFVPPLACAGCVVHHYHLLFLNMFLTLNVLVWLQFWVFEILQKFYTWFSTFGLDGSLLSQNTKF